VFENGTSDLTLFAVQVAQDESKLEGVGIELGGAFELFDRQIDLAGNQVIQPENEVGRLSSAAPVGPSPVDELVPLPRLAGSQAGEQREQDAKDDAVALHVTYVA
jgi:hypothetical protein